MQTVFFDNRLKDSLSNYFRKRRFILLLRNIELIQYPKEPIFILDIGGTAWFWNLYAPILAKTGKRYHIEILNVPGFNDIELLPVSEKITFSRTSGDAKNLEAYQDQSVDVVFSNSVIEHVGSFSDQQKMAQEICRVGRFHFVQTPDATFPVEPHFQFPFWTILPEQFRIWLLTRFNIGWFPKHKTEAEARATLSSIQLLTFQEFKRLFPESKLLKERFMGLSKSFLAIGKGKG